MSATQAQSRPRELAFDPLRWVAPVFVVATLLGLLMRLSFVGISTGIPFDHLLHAHSHALYFGWAGLTILAAAYPDSGWEVKLATWALPVMTLAFLLVGYAPLSIAMSTVMMFAWYLAIWRWWRARRDNLDLYTTTNRIGFTYVILASLGVWAMAYFKATGIGEPMSSRVAIHSFLSNFAWFFLIGTVGLAVRERAVDPTTARRVVYWWAGLGWITFPLGVAAGTTIPFVGNAARIAAILLVYPTWLWVRALWASPAGQGLRWAAIWLAIKMASDVALAVGGEGIHRILGRQGVVIYLHVMLLGYVTTMCVWFLSRASHTDVTGDLVLHQVGTLVMLIGIALLVTHAPNTVALWTAVVGAVIVWFAALRWAPRITYGLGNSSP